MKIDGFQLQGAKPLGPDPPPGALPLDRGSALDPDPGV